MRIHLRKLNPKELDHELIWGSIGLLAVVASLLLVPEMVPARFCPLHELAGVPCPTCGMTRSFLYSGRGNFSEAFKMNPAGAMIFLFLLIYVPYALMSSALNLKRVRLSITNEGTKKLARYAAVMMIFANWAYLIAAGR